MLHFEANIARMNSLKIAVFTGKLRVLSLIRRCITYSKGDPIRRILLCDPNPNVSITVQGWVKSIRSHKEFVFLKISDGSCRGHLQVLASPMIKEDPDWSAIHFGCCVEVHGVLAESPRQDHQRVEVQAERIHILGPCDSLKFPFKLNKKHPPDYARQFLHLRPRTDLFTALLRVRSAATAAVHEYFQTEGFCHVHTPVLTSNDCEGAGEVFQVEPANRELTKLLEDSTACSEHFFNVPTFLTVSGQLHLETVAGAISKVYTFGPTFRAENSRSRHHLSEFYMVEAELAFTETLDDILEVTQGLVKHVCRRVLDTCKSDVSLYREDVASDTHMQTVEKLIQEPFCRFVRKVRALGTKRLTYSEAISILERVQDKFEFKVKWGCDLHKEHERHLVTHCGNVPVFVTDYPREIKPFYMKGNKDTGTVAAVDLLAPDVGEVVGGSLREDNLEILTERLENLGLAEAYDWYVDLRRFGSSPHSGFGLGFERLLQVILGIPNIKDTIPFPRSTHNCQL